MSFAATVALFFVIGKALNTRGDILQKQIDTLKRELEEVKGKLKE